MKEGIFDILKLLIISQLSLSLTFWAFCLLSSFCSWKLYFISLKIIFCFLNFILEKNMIKKLSIDSLTSMQLNPKSIFIFFFSNIFIDIKSLFSLIFFRSENNLSPRFDLISLIFINIFISSNFFIISIFIPSMNNLQTLTSSLAKINSNFEKFKFIFTFDINF